ncbi:MAG: hypothetical protein HKN44_09575 [Ilumatobacter sp.]|nr:hypothetical protein [Ilumatobacter sp.]
MALRVEHGPDGLVIVLSGLDRLMTLRRSVRIEPAHVASASVVDRLLPESSVDHRASGFGTHDGAKRPGRRRVGTMLGRDVVGEQFWAVPAGRADQPVLVLDLVDHEFTRIVIATDDDAELASRFTTPATE